MGLALASLKGTRNYVYGTHIGISIDIDIDMDIDSDMAVSITWCSGPADHIKRRISSLAHT